MANYDPEEAKRIVEEALGLIEKTSKREALALTDSKVLESLNRVLRKYIPHSQDVSLAIDDLKQEILSSYGANENREDKLQQIHTVVSNCRKCPRVIPEPNLPTWNRVDPDVAFITESPLSGKDQYLIQAMKESGFSSTRVCATSVIRCNMQRGEKISPEEIGNCSKNFLFDELKTLAPKLIVPLGKIASSVVLGRDVSLKEERGKVFWLGIWQVLPAMSPRQVDYMPKHYPDLLQDVKRAYSLTYKAKVDKDES